MVGYINDVDAPVIASVVGSGSNDKISVGYSELVLLGTSDTAGDYFSYEVSDGVNPPLTGVSVTPYGDGKSLVVGLSGPMLENTVYTVKVAGGVADLAGNVAGELTMSLRSWVTAPVNGLTLETFEGIGGTAVARRQVRRPYHGSTQPPRE